MTPNLIPRVLLILSAAAFAACSSENGDGSDATDENHGHAHEGSHGGALIEIGDEVAHVELVHDASTGKVTLYLTGSDTKTPLQIADAPELKLMTADGPKVVATLPAGTDSKGASQFSATDPLLKTDPLKGRISLRIDGKPYSPEIEEANDHK